MTTDAAYAALGVPASTPREQVRRAYRLRLRQAHPDHGGNSERFHEIKQAGRVLGVSFKTMRERTGVSFHKPVPQAAPVAHPEPSYDPSFDRLRRAKNNMRLALHYERLRLEAQAQREAEEAAFLARFGIYA